MSVSLEERKRKLAEARAAREAKDKQVLELGEQLSKFSAGSTGAPVIESNLAPKLSDISLEKINLDVPSKMIFVRNLGVVDFPPSEVTKLSEVYTKGVNTDPVFVYDEPRHIPEQRDSESKVEDESCEPSQNAVLSNTVGKVGGSVWDRTAMSSKLIRSKGFLNFIDLASTVMSSALNSSDPISNFFQPETKQSSKGSLIKKGSYLLEMLSRDQMIVVGASFQPGSSEIFAVSFGTGEHPGSTLEPRTSDVVLLWNIRRAAPVSFKFKFEIHTVCFSPFHPNLLFGGSVKGHIVVWDIRSSVSPIGVTFPSLNSHNMPIRFLKVVGDASRNSLLSISVDGRICMWNIDDLRHPTASMIVCSAHSDTTRMSITAASVPQSSEPRDVDASRVFLGSPKGSLFSVTRNLVDRRIIATPLSSFHHEGTINSIDLHPAHEETSVANLILTSSCDWSCRVWLGEASIKIGLKDNVLDARWCPTRPGVFATCDASGTVSLWDLVQSSQSPIGILNLEDSTAPGGRGPVMLYRLSWDEFGDHLIVGGNQGETFYVAVNAGPVEETSCRFVQWVKRNLSSLIA